MPTHPLDFNGISTEAKVVGAFLLVFLAFAFFTSSPAYFLKVRAGRHKQLRDQGKENLLNTKYFQTLYENVALASCIWRSIASCGALVWYDWHYVPNPPRNLVAAGLLIAIPLGGFCYYQLIKDKYKPYDPVVEDRAQTETDFYS